jgi:hypothetical protein
VQLILDFQRDESRNVGQQAVRKDKGSRQHIRWMVAHLHVSSRIILFLEFTHFKIHSPMVLTSWIERASTCCAFAPALHVLFHRQNMFTVPTQYCSFVSAIPRPHIRFVRLACVVAADASVEFVAAKMFDGNDVERRMPMHTLRKRRDRDTVDCGDDWRRGGLDVGHVVWCMREAGLKSR